MKITKEQNKRILSLDVGGYGGYDSEIATALGFTRESAKFYDAIDANGNKYEFKKQASQQWIDVFKMSQLSDDEKKIPVLFFVHKEGKVTEIYETNYKKLIKKMGMGTHDLRAISKLYSREAISESIQMKSPLNFSSIKTFKKIWERSWQTAVICYNI